MHQLLEKLLLVLFFKQLIFVFVLQKVEVGFIVRKHGCQLANLPLYFIHGITLFILVALSFVRPDQVDRFLAFDVDHFALDLESLDTALLSVLDRADSALL